MVDCFDVFFSYLEVGWLAESRGDREKVDTRISCLTHCKLLSRIQKNPDTRSYWIILFFSIWNLQPQSTPSYANEYAMPFFFFNYYCCCYCWYPILTYNINYISWLWLKSLYTWEKNGAVESDTRGMPFRKAWFWTTGNQEGAETDVIYSDVKTAVYKSQPAGPATPSELFAIPFDAKRKSWS